jgi:hypothetical protein
MHLIQTVLQDAWEKTQQTRATKGEATSQTRVKVEGILNDYNDKLRSLVIKIMVARGLEVPVELEQKIRLHQFLSAEGARVLTLLIEFFNDPAPGSSVSEPWTVGQNLANG